MFLTLYLAIFTQNAPEHATGSGQGLFLEDEEEEMQLIEDVDFDFEYETSIIDVDYLQTSGVPYVEATDIVSTTHGRDASINIQDDIVGVDSDTDVEPYE